MRSLAEEFTRRGHEVKIVAPGPVVQPETEERYEIIPLGRYKQIGFSATRFEITLARRGAVREVAQRLRDWGADIVHFHTMWTPLMPLQLFSCWQGATVSTFHDMPPDTLTGNSLRTLFKGMSWMLLSRLDGAITVSRAPAGHLRPGRHGVVPEIIPPTIDLAPFQLRQSDKGKPPGDEVRLLFVGRLEVRKGLPYLLDAWRLVDAARRRDSSLPKLHLTIAGYGKLSHEVHRMIDEVEPGTVELVDAMTRDAVSQRLRDADIFLATSPWGESFGLVLVEAMTSGAPVLAADNDGYSSVMTGRGTECLFEAGNAKSMAAAILDLAADPEKRARLRAWGLEHARQFDVREVAPRIEAVYARAIERHKVGGKAR